jgi:hypothetical protein
MLRHPSSLLGLVFMLLLSLLAGCATSKTATKKDINVFRPGVAREIVIDEVGYSPNSCWPSPGIESLSRARTCRN